MTLNETYNYLFALIRTAVNGEPLPGQQLDGEAWKAVYSLACRQSMVGVVYTAVRRLDGLCRPPIDVLLRWTSEAETVRGLNQLMNDEAARLTRLFAAEGRQTAVLKGQANALLYPEPLSRQPGDIDLWVEGGRERVVSLLVSMDLLDERPVAANIGKKGKATMSYHHVHLPPTADGVVVEIHFRPASGNFNPVTNRRLQAWLEAEVVTGITHTAEGFCAPSVRFALLMQLAHIQRHFISGGVGLRQLADYSLLLQSATADDLSCVSSHLRSFGLQHMAGALMWVLHQVFRQPDEAMLCQPDERRGVWLLREVMEGGNFGRYAERRQHGLWQRVLKGRLRSLRLMRFDFWEAFWVEARYWKTILRTLPLRIKYRTLSLGTLAK